MKIAAIIVAALALTGCKDKLDVHNVYQRTIAEQFIKSCQANQKLALFTNIQNENDVRTAVVKCVPQK